MSQERQPNPRGRSLDRSLDFGDWTDVDSPGFDRVRRRQLSEANRRNASAWVWDDSRAGVWTTALFAGFGAPAVVAWSWGGFEAESESTRGLLRWLLGALGALGVPALAWTLFVLAGARRVRESEQRRWIRLLAVITAASTSAATLAEAFGRTSVLAEPLADQLPRLALLPILLLGVLGITIARIGRDRHGTAAARWCGPLGLVLFVTLLIWPGWRSDAVVVTFILLPLAIGVSRGGIALWT
ncbi:MAG: hypothetical protein EBU70_13715, partial [Actinobacteria bacterium]|nr:hypothetical protein [Actinomycetota bacterium]